MGLFGNSAPPAALQAFQPALGVNPHYCVAQPTTLVLKEKAFTFSGDDFSVKDAAGVTVCKVEGKSMSMRDKKNFKDVNGNLLFSLETKLIAIRKTFFATGPDGREQLFEVKKKMALTSKMVATFKNASDGQEIELVCRGDFLAKSCDIALGDRPVASISRKLLNAREAFTDSQTYYVTVAPGVDLAMMAAIAVCFDECQHEKN